MIVIDDTIVVPARDLEITTSRSPGPGGQNVNKVETRVTLWMDLDATGALDDDQKALIRSRLASRIDRRGRLRVSVHRHRTQHANREEALQRLSALLAQALHRDPPRRPTRASASSRRRRLNAKRRVAEKKRLRRPPPEP